MKKWILLILLMSTPCYAADYYTVDTAIDQVRMLIPETANRFFTDTEIENWIKEAVEDISVRTLCIQDTDTIALSTGTYEYTDLVTGGADAIADIVKVWGCLYENPDDEYIGLKRIELWQVSTLQHMQDGPPVYYYHFADTIGILPLPSSSQNGDTVKVYHSKQSQTIGDLPNEYQSLTFLYAASLACDYMGDAKRAEKYYTMYLEKIKTLNSAVLYVKPDTK